MAAVLQEKVVCERGGGSRKVNLGLKTGRCSNSRRACLDSKGEGTADCERISGQLHYAAEQGVEFPFPLN